MNQSQPKSLPQIYRDNWIPAENNADLFISTFISPDINKPYHPTDEQNKFIEAMSSGKYVEGWFAGGNSSGKTWTAKFMATWFGSYKIRPLSNKPFTSYTEYLQTPYNILCTGPESKQAMELWQAIEESFKNSPILRFNVDNVTTGSRRNIHPSIVLTNGTKIEAVGLQDKGKHIEGQAYDLVLINEPPDVRHLIHAYEKVLLPRTWRRDGLICGFGTPKGKNDYYNLWRRGKKNLNGIHNKYWESRIYSQISDSRSNPYANQDAIVRGMEGKSESYIKERIEGDFVDSAFSAFKDSEVDECIDTELKPRISPSSNHQYIHGIDFGRKGDFTGMITWDVSVNPHIQVNVYRNGGGVASWENIFEDILNIYKMYRGECIVDSTGMAGDMQLSWLDDLNIPYIAFTFGGSPMRKVALINNLQDYISKRKFKMPPHDQLLSEIRGYPSDFEDKGIETDLVMALALVAWGARNYEPLAPVEMYSR